MTSYPPTYFDKTPGTLEQLVLGVITQRLANSGYTQQIIRDFTTDSVNWNVAVDALDSDAPTATLNISLVFPTVPFDRRSLTDASSFDRRVASVNTLSIDTLSLPQKSSYPIKSFPAQLPLYLSRADEQNTLERRLLALCLHIRDVKNWIVRWNFCTLNWIMVNYYGVINPNRTAAIINIERDNLLLELTNGFNYKLPPTDILFSSYPITPSVSNPGNARAEIESLSNDSLDPANVQQLPLSSNLLSELKQQLESNFAGNSPESVPQSTTPLEVPSLPDC